MTPIRNVVAAIDFDETSEETLTAALELARIREGRIHVIHAVPDALRVRWLDEGPDIDLHDVQERWVREARQQLIACAAKNGLDPLTTTISVVVGPAANAETSVALTSSSSVPTAMGSSVASSWAACRTA